VLTLGQGTAIYTLDPASGRFCLTTPRAEIPRHGAEFAINASNYRHWDDGVRHYVDDCLRGRDGPRGVDFNMRWTASPVAEFVRILERGGVFLYPGDARANYGSGRLRLAYEAAPFAMIVEQAGGLAIDGQTAILDIAPKALHQHVPMIAGSSGEVEVIARYLAEPPGPGECSPLFARRGLFRM
jgi:fructose-1,6-bisphosphatase I